MINLDIQYLPLYLAELAAVTTTIKYGVESIANFSKTFFGARKVDQLQKKEHTPYFKQGIKASLMSILSAAILYLLIDWDRKQTPEKTDTLVKSDFEACKRELEAFLRSAAYLDVLSFPKLDRFCADYMMSLEAYARFLERENVSDTELSGWVTQIKPYFTFTKWVDQTLSDLKRDYQTSLAVSEQKFKAIQEQLKEKISIGMTLDWAFLCEYGFENWNDHCGDFLKMKADLKKLQEKKIELDSLTEKVNQYYQVNKCGGVLDLTPNEAKVLEVDFKQYICSKLPFNQTSLC